MSPFPLKPGMGPPMESPEADAYLQGPITPFRADIEHDGPRFDSDTFPDT
jgi:hypothetical protein